MSSPTTQPGQTSTTPTTTPTTTSGLPTGTKPPPSASLYVGDLSPEVTEPMLFEIFNTVGPLHSIRVLRDTLTRRSLGYAYVNFVDIRDAERALDTLNTSVIMHRPCRIMWSQRDPSVRKSGAGNIFVKNLDASVGFKDLYDWFSEHGSILSCKVALNETTGQSKGYGFVHFESESSAKEAVEKMNGKVIQGKAMFVGPFVPKKLRNQNIEKSWTNVYVKDIDPEVSDEEFKQLFEAFGPVNSPLLKRNEKGLSEGYGFVNFLRHEDAKVAVEKLNGHKLKNKAIVCCRAQKRAEREAKLKREWEQQKFNKYHGINLYVKHIEDEIDEETLKREFSAFGEVKSCKIPIDEKGSSKGFGFVCFSTPEDAQKAINGLNSKILQGQKKPLFVTLHEPKEIRRQKLSHRHNLSMTKNIRGVQQPMYGPQGQPVFYPNGSVPQGAFMYPPQQVIPPMQRQGWGPQQFQGMPPSNYGMPGMMGRPGGQGPRTNAGGNQGGVGNAGGNQGGQAGQGGQGRQQRGNRQGGQGNRRPQNPMVMEPSELTIQHLSQYPHDQQKLLIGERLYPLIVPSQGTLAGKITGMFLDSGWSIEELLSLVHDEQKLQQKIENALDVLARAGQQPVEQRDETETQ
jgi:polyadenylate-binding protein